MQRRDFLGIVGWTSASLTLAGCGCKQMIIPADRCADWIAPSDLMIDAHCHVFNASDLLVAGFLRDVVALESKHPWAELIRLFAQNIQDIGWELAPTIAEERQALAQTTPPPPSIDQQKLSTHLAQAAVLEHKRESENRYREGVDRLMSIPAFKDRYRRLYKDKAVKSAANRQLLLSPADVVDVIEKPKRTIADVRALQAIERQSGMSGPFSFLEPFFSFRYINCKTVFDAFTCRSSRLDLICPAMVDFDHWLLKSEVHPKSPIADQIDLMARIAQFFGGMVHSYAPFNPWSASVDPTYFDTVTRAVTEHGFIGIKIYPPMGFAPTENAGIKTPLDNWPPNEPNFGARIDEQLLRLYRFAADHKVGILSHCSPSNVTSSRVYNLFAPDRWQTMLDLKDASGAAYFRADAAHICFGHFGGDNPNNGSHWATDLGQKITTNPAAYADLSYYEDILYGCVDHMKERLGDSLKLPHISERLLYGSDWNLLGQETDWEAYLAKFAATLPELFPKDSQAAVKAIMGRNATGFFGLGEGMAARQRLDTLYKDVWHVAPPGWTRKI